MSGKDKESPVVDGDCLAAMDHLYAFLSGELDERSEDYAMVKHHLGHCRSCFSRAEMERLLGERLRSEGKDKAPEALRGRLRKLMEGL